MPEQICCHIANALVSRLELIWPIFHLKISKKSEKLHFWQKALGVNRLKKWSSLGHS